MIKAVLFDVDGTLISLDASYGALHEMLKEFGLSLSKKDFMEKVVGVTLHEKIPVLFPESKDRVAEMDRRYHELFNAHHMRYGKLLPHVRDTTALLRSRGLSIGIVTTKRRHEAQCALQDYDISYDVLVAQEDVRRRKPDPEPTAKALHYLGIKPAEAVFVGDHPFDMMSAKSAGCKAVGVLTGWGDEAKLKKAGADYTIKDLGGLSKAIGLEE
jgi:pyrophosphatase PpaX